MARRRYQKGNIRKRGKRNPVWELQWWADCINHLVFQTRNGTPFSDTNLLHKYLKPAGRKLGMPWLNWHTLRRTHATLLQHAGATLREAQAQLGHTKMSTTLEIYTISIPAAQRKAVENLSNLVTNGDELGQLGGNLPLATERIQ